MEDPLSRRISSDLAAWSQALGVADPNALLFRIGHRMRSRLHEMCDFAVMDGADYREMPVNGGVDDLIALWKTRKRNVSLPARAGRNARAQLREPMRDGKADLKWPGGRAGSD